MNEKETKMRLLQAIDDLERTPDRQIWTGHHGRIFGTLWEEGMIEVETQDGLWVRFKLTDKGRLYLEGKT